MKRKTTGELEERSKLDSLLRSYAHPGPVEWMRTGIHAVDLALGGGLPRGRIIEIAGPDFVGKTLLGLSAMAAFQRAGAACMFANSEAGETAERIENLGVDIERIRYEEPETVEQFRHGMHDFVESVRKVDKKAPIYILLDSVANLTSDNQWEDDKELGEVPKDNGQPGVRALAFSKFFAEFAVYLKRNDVTLVCNNQIRDKIGAMFGKKTDSPGGHALKHNASVRIDLGRGKKFENADRTEYQGCVCYFRVEKNRFATPFRKVELRINPTQGFDPWSGLPEILLASKRLTLKKAGVFRFGEEEFASQELPAFVEKHPELLAPWL